MTMVNIREVSKVARINATCVSMPLHGHVTELRVRDISCCCLLSHVRK